MPAAKPDETTWLCIAGFCASIAAGFHCLAKPGAFLVMAGGSIVTNYGLIVTAGRGFVMHDGLIDKSDGLIDTPYGGFAACYT